MGTPFRGPSTLEPRQQGPERVACRRNKWRAPSTRATLRPRRIRPQPFSDPASGGVGRYDEGLRQREPPGGLLGFEAATAAAGSDEVADLVQGDEVAHLPPDGRHADLEAALGAAVAMLDADDDGTAAPWETPDAVRGAEIVDVEVERPGLHGASVVGARSVAGSATDAAWPRFQTRIQP